MVTVDIEYYSMSSIMVVLKIQFIMVVDCKSTWAIMKGICCQH